MKIKNLLAALALCAATFTANAAIIATTENSGGGVIALFTERGGGEENWHLVMSTNSGEKPFYGCWTLVKELQSVVIEWEDGEIRTYSPADFKVIDREEEKKEA